MQVNKTTRELIIYENKSNMDRKNFILEIVLEYPSKLRYRTMYGKVIASQK